MAKGYFDRRGVQDVLILASFEDNDLQVSLRRIDGCTDKSLFYQMTLTRIAHTSNRTLGQVVALAQQLDRDTPDGRAGGLLGGEVHD